MINNFDKLNKGFENRVRLGIMSILMVNDYADFNFLKENLKLTDGNLASHLKALEKLEYIEMRKEFIGRKPNTKYMTSKLGKMAFGEHLDALESFLKNRK
ncbi:MAG: DNA-binding transcriptional ArsR family regulator [Bacteroidia bacterium]